MWNYFLDTPFSFFLFQTAGCKSDSECPLTQTCLNRECVDPCLFEKCGINAQCSAKNHRAVCSCLPDFKPDPDPYIRCKQYECLTDPDCIPTLACRNEKCVNPCQCARFADCAVRNHRGVCTCFPGYEGDPYGIACTPSKLKTIAEISQHYCNACVHVLICYVAFFSSWTCKRRRMQRRQRLP